MEAVHDFINDNIPDDYIHVDNVVDYVLENKQLLEEILSLSSTVEENKKYCIWCMKGMSQNDEYLRIHKDCLYEIEDRADDLTHAKESLSKLTKFLENSENFSKRWKKAIDALSSTKKENKK